MRTITTLIFLTVIHELCYAQDVNSKWEANFIYSLGIPTGAFGAVDPTTSVSYVSPNVPQLNGFDKKGHAAAGQGLGIEFTLTRSLSTNFSVSLAVGTTSSPVQVAPLNDYLDQVFGYGMVRTSQANYLTYSLAPGLQYNIQRKKWVTNFGQFVGTSMLRFPEYDMLLSNNGPGDTVVKHEGNKPDSHSIWLSTNLSIRRLLTKHLSVQLSFCYASANFPYQVALRMVPGGSNTTIRADEVPFHIIKAGIGIGYRF